MGACCSAPESTEDIIQKSLKPRPEGLGLYDAKKRIPDFGLGGAAPASCGRCLRCCARLAIGIAPGARAEAQERSVARPSRAGGLRWQTSATRP